MKARQFIKTAIYVALAVFITVVRRKYYENKRRARAMRD